MFVALIVLVAMALAALALIRSVDTTTAVVGNLGFRQASVLPANAAVEEAVAALFEKNTIADKAKHLPAQNYYATKQAGEDSRGIPGQLQKRPISPSCACCPRRRQRGALRHRAHVFQGRSRVGFPLRHDASRRGHRHHDRTRQGPFRKHSSGPVLPSHHSRGRSAQHRVVPPGDVALTSPPPGKAMATFFRPTLFRRFVAALLSALMSLGPVATPAYAAGDRARRRAARRAQPVKPNILMTVDDSTSMLYDFLPDYVVLENDNAGILKPTTFCRSGNGSMSATCGFWDQPYDLTGAVPSGGKYQSPQYIFQQYNMPYRANVGATVAFDVSGPGAGCETVNPPLRCSAGIDPTAGGSNLRAEDLPGGIAAVGKPYEYWLLWPAPAHNSALNKLYYNPRLNYDPPIGDDGNPLPNMNAANTSNWTQVPADPWATTVIKVDLTAKVTVGQWCNSDWTQGNDALGNPFGRRPAAPTAPSCDVQSSADGDYIPSPPLGITANDPFSRSTPASRRARGQR
jgi:hypothetical protein